MKRPYVIPATEAHARQMAPILRAADRAEIEALSGVSPTEALLHGLHGDACLAGFTGDDRPVCMFGVSQSTGPGEAFVWLMATTELERVGMTFLRQGRAYFDAFHDIYPLLHNYVDARNELHIRWLKWLGCTFIQTNVIMGVQQRPFHEFVRTKPCATQLVALPPQP